MKRLLNKTIRIFFVGIIIASFILVDSTTIKAERLKTERFNMSYLYFGNSQSFVEYIPNTKGALNTISPSYFDLSADGYLDEKVDPFFVAQMKKMNIRVVPFLSNHWNRQKGREALKNREKLVDQLVDVITKYDLDGINVDLENLTADDRDNYTDLIRLLREKLPPEKEVSVAVAANPYKLEIGWQGSYDYEELAKFSDYLMLMTYDESYYGSEPGPVASLKFVEKSIEYALEKVPPEKLVLGIPFYGRYWKIGEKGGRGISISKVEELVDEFNGKVYFDNKSKTPYAVFTIPKDEHPKVHYRKLTPGKYIVWYEDDKSLKLKLRLVEKYNLLGTGSWSLNEAPKNIWNYYQSWLDGKHYFIDTEKHWAENDILSMLDRGWMVGTSEENFSPNLPLSRAQAVVVIVRALGLNNDFSVDNFSNFVDVDADYWAKNEIEIAYRYGIIKGVKEGYFAPNEPLTRAQMAAILSRILIDKNNVQIAEKPIDRFEDVNFNHWAYADIINLSTRNIFMGYTDGKFHPNDYLSRGQMAALMNRIASKIMINE
ncbi:hypothetical protein BHF71_02925 [Vulcanibacillus modesticaldus]|uniref:Glycoside hydrolase n=1 Tax=Vulcanibacillus modesticaldus TaxID=337097 RepID=A0A1D2YTC3_9BACI|nr:glycosyl hydrolase family 18 protein [Vulcanibacillus modesticaldus]OEF98931.1 hypothetical protein BHF71_02925 [Vulcanibacillus modesticaldus]